MYLIHTFIFCILEVKIMTTRSSSFILTHPSYIIWFLNSVLRFLSWDQGPKTWTLLFSTCKYLKASVNMKIKKSNQVWSCKRKTGLLRLFSNFSCHTFKTFYFNHLFMSDFPSLLCPQHITNRLILCQGSIYIINCLPIQGNRHSSPSSCH